MFRVLPLTRSGANLSCRTLFRTGTAGGASLEKQALLAIDRHTRAFALVGAYLGHFALLEQGINDAISEVLELKGARSLIVTRNMSFGEKIKTLRALVNFFVFDPEMAKLFDRLALQARKISEERNIVAHTPFRASESGDGVTFFVVSASRTLTADDAEWSIDDFLSRIDHIITTDNALREIEHSMSLQRIAEALLKDEKPLQNALGGLFGLGGMLLEEQKATSGLQDGSGGGPQ